MQRKPLNPVIHTCEIPEDEFRACIDSTHARLLEESKLVGRFFRLDKPIDSAYCEASDSTLYTQVHVKTISGDPRMRREKTPKE